MMIISLFLSLKIYSKKQDHLKGSGIIAQDTGASWSQPFRRLDPWFLFILWKQRMIPQKWRGVVGYGQVRLGGVRWGKVWWGTVTKIHQRNQRFNSNDCETLKNGGMRSGKLWRGAVWQGTVRWGVVNNIKEKQCQINSEEIKKSC